MIDLEGLEVKVSKDIDHFQHRYNLSHRDTANLLFSLGLDCYLRDLASRSINGRKAPYLVNWHIKQGIKYYQQDLVRQ